MQLDGGWLRLFAGATKNGKARAVALPDDLRAVLQGCAAGKNADSYLFTWPNGDPILDFRSAWAKATKAAELPGLLFHDLRRSAVRRMRKKSVPTAVAMRITGHLMRTVFDNYDAAHDTDVQDAAQGSLKTTSNQSQPRADVAELADAMGLGPIVRKNLQVRFLSSAPATPRHLGSSAARRAGSSPVPGTRQFRARQRRVSPFYILQLHSAQPQVLTSNPPASTRWNPEITAPVAIPDRLPGQR